MAQCAQCGMEQYPFDSVSAQWDGSTVWFCGVEHRDLWVRERILAAQEAVESVPDPKGVATELSEDELQAIRDDLEARFGPSVVREDEPEPDSAAERLEEVASEAGSALQSEETRPEAASEAGRVLAEAPRKRTRGAKKDA